MSALRRAPFILAAGCFGLATLSAFSMIGPGRVANEFGPLLAGLFLLAAGLAVRG